MPDLIASWFTLAGVPVKPVPPYAGPSGRTIGDRLDAAGAAGFTGLGMRYDDYPIFLAGGGDPDWLRGKLDGLGMTIGEIEFIDGWTSKDPEVRRQARAIEADLFMAADALGARQVNAGTPDLASDGGALPLDGLIEEFAGVCDRAREHGLVVALEPMPWNIFPDVASAWAVAGGAGRDNGGLLIDTWHYFRGPSTDDQLRAVPPEGIVGIQINDADRDVVGTIIEDSIHLRRLPGEGSFDLVGFIQLIDELGVTAPIAIEVIADAQAALPLDEAARRAYDTTAAVVAAARRTP
jgi:sugar phosphate isomerase/epimerase